MYLLICFLGSLTLSAGERIDKDINWKIRRAETENSQVMRIVHYFTDVYGPRLTGSPNLKAAGEWAVRQMTEWGLQNGRLEAWDFGHPGWTNESYSAHVVSPYQEHLVCEVVAWTPGTRGPVRAEAVQVVPPEQPTKEELTAFFDSIREKVRGRIVLVGAHRPVPVTFNLPPKRREDAEVRAQYDPNNPAAQAGPPRPPQQAEPPREGPGRLTSREVDEQLDAFLLSGGARVRVGDAARDHGQVRVFGNRTYDPSKVIPGIVLRSEDYGRISRVLADGTAVEMEVRIENTIHPEGKTSYNAIAEIPGGDRRDEVIMLGGHLDSWHGATGAADNATGCAVMMEAARVLQALGVKPRRTIRVALWGGEEQGLLGSKAYVEQHFGTFESPKAGFDKLVGYLNIDSGTGRVRGASIFGPPEAATVLREILAPFEDLGVMGAMATTRRNRGGTDSTSFNWAGLAGIGFQQDPIEYGTHTWHTNLDTYERVIEDDLRKSAIVVASVVYHLAMREEMLPRFSKDKMPPPVPEPPARPSNLNR
ncbi:MAG: M20/M25/M40 family metallo-hydrolase [Acidobacteria bacterium]|nr:M20/M25/M40 family metallo-hydrolase [Acidobacteriota bacterium]